MQQVTDLSKVAVEHAVGELHLVALDPGLGCRVWTFKVYPGPPEAFEVMEASCALKRPEQVFKQSLQYGTKEDVLFTCTEHVPNMTNKFSEKKYKKQYRFAIPRTTSKLAI